MTKFFTVDEVAGHLKLSPATIRLYIRRGHLAAVDLNGHYRVKASVLAEFINARQTTVQPEVTDDGKIR